MAWILDQKGELTEDYSNEDGQPLKMVLSNYLAIVEQDLDDLQQIMARDSGELTEHLSKLDSARKLSKVRSSFEKELLHLEKLKQELDEKVFTIDPSGSLSAVDQPDPPQFIFLQESGFGDRIWPILPICILGGTLIGLVLGLSLGLFIAILIWFFK